MTIIDPNRRPIATTSDRPSTALVGSDSGAVGSTNSGTAEVASTTVIPDVIASGEARARFDAERLLANHDAGSTTPVNSAAGAGMLNLLALNSGGSAAGAAGASATAAATGATVGANGQPRYDVTTTSDADIAALRRGNATQQRLANTISNAKRSFADHIAAGGRVVVTSSAGNGGQPVLTLVPPGFDPSKPARVHTHYHGWNSTVADGRNHSTRRLENMRAAQTADPQTVFVLPECQSAPLRGTGSNYQTDWSNVKNQAQTTDDALAAAGVDPGRVREHVVSAHSGGGKALHYTMAAHPDGSGLRADRLQLFDCCYGDWDQAMRDWATTANGRRASAVTFYHGTNDQPRVRAQNFRLAYGDRFRIVQVGDHNATVARYLDAAR